MKKGSKKLVTLREFAEKKKKDASYVNKLARKFKIPLINAKRASDGRIVKVATLSQWEALLSSVKTMNTKTLAKGDVTLDQAAKILSMEKSNLLKYAKKHGVKCFYANNGKTRVVNCFSKADIARLQKMRPQLPIV